MATRSPVLNMMIRAADKAAKSLKRDFGEVENLQVSAKGAGDFVSRADIAAEMDISRSTIDKHMIKARLLLRRCLQRLEADR